MNIRYRTVYEPLDLIYNTDEFNSEFDFFQSLSSITTRNQVKELLGILNPTFSKLFKDNTFKQDKKENLFYLDLLIDEFDKYYSTYEDTEEFKIFYNQMCDLDYDTCVKAEAAVKEAKRRPYEADDYETVILKKEKELQKALEVDTFDNVINYINSKSEEIHTNITEIITYYVKNPTESIRKQENRNRDAIFYYILHLLSLFYDTACYIPDGYIEGIKEEELKWYIPLSKRLEYEINGLSLLGVIYGALKCKKETEEYKKEIEKSKERLKSLVGLAREIEERKLKTLLLKTFSLGEVKLESYMGICEVAEFYYKGPQEF